MSRILYLGQLLLPRDAGAFKAPNISPSTCLSRRRGGKCSSLVGEAFGGNFWPLNLLHARAGSKSQKRPARAHGWGTPHGKKEKSPRQRFQSIWATSRFFWGLKPKVKARWFLTRWTCPRRSPAPGFALSQPGGSWATSASLTSGERMDPLLAAGEGGSQGGSARRDCAVSPGCRGIAAL